MPDNLQLIVLIGQTAVGKSKMAFELFQQFENIEIVSADSRQIFRYMNIGTAKPSLEELNKYPHHCVDIKYPNEYFSAGEFGRLARSTCKDLKSNSKIPLVVGGSGLYIQSLVDGLFQMEVQDPEIKNILQEQANKGLEKLYEQLLIVDPIAAEKIHANDRQRILRALEVYQITGEPISQLRRKSKKRTGINPVFVGLIRNRQDLYKIIDKRVDNMINSGLIDEVVKLRKKNYHAELQSQKTVGYSEIHNFLEGEMDKETTTELIKRNSRRFAKRQLTWFSKNKSIHWFSIDTERDWLSARSFIIEELSKFD